MGDGELGHDDPVGQRAGGGVIIHAGDPVCIRIRLLLPWRRLQPVQILGRADGHGPEIRGRNAQVIVDIGSLIFDSPRAVPLSRRQIDPLQAVFRPLADGFLLCIENGLGIALTVIRQALNHLKAIDIALRQHDRPAFGIHRRINRVWPVVVYFRNAESAHIVVVKNQIAVPALSLPGCVQRNKAQRRIEVRVRTFQVHIPVAHGGAKGGADIIVSVIASHGTIPVHLDRLFLRQDIEEIVLAFLHILILALQGTVNLPFPVPHDAGFDMRQGAHRGDSVLPGRFPGIDKALLNAEIRQLHIRHRHVNKNDIRFAVIQRPGQGVPFLIETARAGQDNMDLFPIAVYVKVIVFIIVHGKALSLER